MIWSGLPATITWQCACNECCDVPAIGRSALATRRRRRRRRGRVNVTNEHALYICVQVRAKHYGYSYGNGHAMLCYAGTLRTRCYELLLLPDIDWACSASFCAFCHSYAVLVFRSVFSKRTEASSRSLPPATILFVFVCARDAPTLLLFLLPLRLRLLLPLPLLLLLLLVLLLYQRLWPVSRRWIVACVTTAPMHHWSINQLIYVLHHTNTTRLLFVYYKNFSFFFHPHPSNIQTTSARLQPGNERITM